MKDEGPNSILTVCKRHEENIQEFLARNTKLKRRRSLGAVLPDAVFSDQTQPPTELDNLVMGSVPSHELFVKWNGTDTCMTESREFT